MAFGVAAIPAMRARLSAQGASKTTPANAAAYAASSLAEYESLAKSKLHPAGWEYYSLGAGDGLTLRANRDALNRVQLTPQILTDVSKIDTQLTLLGEKMSHPIMLAPASSHMCAHPEGEVATARGAAAAEATMVISSYCNRSLEDITAAAPGPRWFQLYVDDDRAVTKELIQKAESVGCGALCVTVDLPIPMPRNARDVAVKPGTPMYPFPLLGGNGGPGGQGIAKRRSGAFSWKDLEWVASVTKKPVILKGVLSPADARLAVKAGVAGIIVSNHGGRALDSVPATIEALPRVVDAVEGRLPILMDGGIRRGVDVLKALALGATAVLIGRPYLYALAVGGPDGVQHVIDILRRELRFAMALTGRTSLGAIDSSVIWR